MSCHRARNCAKSAVAAAVAIGALTPGLAAAQRRMALIPAEQLSPEQRAAAQVYRDARGRELRGGLFMDLLRVPDAMLGAFRMRDHVQKRSLFGERLTQMAILIMLREWTQRQEWSGHANEAANAGLDPAIIRAIAEGYRPPAMSADEAALYDFLLELQRNHNVSDPTYARVVGRWGEAGVIEAIQIAGLYTIVGMTLNTVREPIPQSYNPLPEYPQLKPAPDGVYSNPVPLFPESALPAGPRP
jgi:4-carboxymuconolactone decarboxylase